MIMELHPRCLCGARWTHTIPNGAVRCCACYERWVADEIRLTQINAERAEKAEALLREYEEQDDAETEREAALRKAAKKSGDEVMKAALGSAEYYRLWGPLLERLGGGVDLVITENTQLSERVQELEAAIVFSCHQRDKCVYCGRKPKHPCWSDCPFAEIAPKETTEPDAAIREAREKIAADPYLLEQQRQLRESAKITAEDLAVTITRCEPDDD